MKQLQHTQKELDATLRNTTALTASNGSLKATLDATHQLEEWIHTCQFPSQMILRRERLHRRNDCHDPGTDMEQRLNLWILTRRCWRKRRSLKRLHPLMAMACQHQASVQILGVQWHANACRQGS